MDDIIIDLVLEYELFEYYSCQDSVFSTSVFTHSFIEFKRIYKLSYIGQILESSNLS